MRAGYADGAAARWRTLHEIAVTGSFLVEHGEDAAERYLAHFPCEQLKGARAYNEHARALGYRRLDRRHIRRLECQVNVLAQRYGKPFPADYGWAAHGLQRGRVTFAAIEEAVKLPFMRPFYRLASEQVHASSRGSFVRGGVIGQALPSVQVLAGPSNYGFADPAINSVRALMLATANLGQVDPTVDTNVMSMILARWSTPLVRDLAKVQAGIEQREGRLRPRRGGRASSKAKAPAPLPSPDLIPPSPASGDA